MEPQRTGRAYRTSTPAMCMGLFVVAAWAWTAQAFAQTLYLDNSVQTNAQYVTLATSGSGDAVLKPVRLSIEMWVKAAAWNQTAGGSYASLISNTSSSGYDIYVDGTNMYFEAWADGHGYQVASYAVSNFAADQSYHIAATWNGRQAKLYVNGVLVNSSSDLGSDINIVYASSTHTILGCEAATAGGTEAGYYFTGKFRDVRIWNAARTEAEIRADMSRTLIGNESGLIGYYQLNESSGTTADNAVTGAPDGTLYNSPTWVAATVPIVSLPVGYTTSPQAMWGATGTNESRASGGLTMYVTTTLTDGNYTVFGHNNATGTSESDVPTGITSRTARIWHFAEGGFVPPYVKVDLTEAVGVSFTPGPANSYDLLYRPGTTGEFTPLCNGSSFVGSVVLFEPGSIDPGYFVVGGMSSGPLPVERLSMTAQVVGCGVELRWQMATETDNAGFEIERREISNRELPASNYLKVGFVAGAGTSTSPREYNFADAPAPGRYAYRLKQIDRDGTSSTSGEVEVVVGATPTALLLGEAYPNPFNPTTTLEFSVAEDALTSLKVYNTLGEEVATLFTGMAKAGFLNRATFDASGLTSGIYFYRLTTGAQTLTKRMMLMK